MTKNKKILTLALSSVAAVATIGITVGILASSCSKQNTKKPNKNKNDYNEVLGYYDTNYEKAIGLDSVLSVFNNNIKNKPLYGNSYKVVDSYKRNVQKQVYKSDIESTTDFFGWPSLTKNNYQNKNSPTYSLIQKIKATKPNFNINQALKEHNKFNGNSFTSQDFISEEIKNNRFKKHPAADAMFEQFSIKDEQPAVKKAFSIAENTPTMYMTGLYSVPGEVIKLTIPKDSIETIKNKKIKIVIGDEWQDMTKDNQPYWLAAMRLPYMITTFDLNKLIENYATVNSDESITVPFGSVYGGTIVFKIGNNNINGNKTINFTLDGAIEYLHYDLGITTDEEWFRLVNNTNTPISTINSDTTIIFRPLFVNNESTHSTIDTTILKKAKLNSPFWFAMAYRAQTVITQYINGIDLYGGVSYKLPVYANDYVAARSASGGGVNLGGTSVQTPMWWYINMFDPNLDNFNGGSEWGNLHEINHSYEQFYFFNNRRPEVYNNVANVLNFSILSPTSAYRIINPSSFLNNGWNSTSNLYSIFNPQYKNGDFNVTSNDAEMYWGLFSLVHLMGPKKFIEYARSSRISRSNQSVRTMNGKVYDHASWSMYQICEILKSDITDYLEDTLRSGLRQTGATDGSTQQTLNDWNELKTIIKSKYVAYRPIANMYASQQGYKQKNGQWYFPGDTLKPAIIDAYAPTKFDMVKWTKSSYKFNQNNPVKITEVKIIDQPKLGSLSVQKDKTTLIYIPNSSENKINKVDEFVVELLDNYGNEARIKINVQLLTFSNYQDTIYDINPNIAISVNQNNSFKILEEIKKPGSHNNKDVLAFFNNFDNYKNQVAQESNMDVYINKNGVATESKKVTNQQLRETKFIYKPEKTGYYRFNGFFEHNDYQNFDYGIVNGGNLVDAIFIQNERRLLNANGQQYGKKFEPETKPILLEKDQVYEFSLYSIIKSQNVDSSLTYKNITINFVGTDQNSLNGEISPAIDQPWNTEVTSYSKNDLDAIFNNKDTKYIDDFEILSSIKYEDIFHFSHNPVQRELNIFDYFKIQENINNGVVTKNISGKMLSPKEEDVLLWGDTEQNMLNRWAGLVESWFQIQCGKNEKTRFDFEIDLAKPFTFQQINFKMHSQNESFQKIKVIDTSNSSNEIVYDGYVNNWWEDESKSYISFEKQHTFNNKIRFVISKDEDNRETTPDQFKQIAKNSQKQLIKGYWNTFRFKNISNELAYIDYAYDSYSDELVIDNNWNVTNENAFYNSRKLISRIDGAKIEFNVENVSQIKIFGDKLPTTGKLEFYINDKLYQVINCKGSKLELMEILSTINLPNKQKQKISIVSKDVDINNPVSIQAIGIIN